MRKLSLFSERLAFASASGVVVDSSSLLTRVQELDLISAGKGRVLGRGSCCGVDTEYFCPPEDQERIDA